MKRLLKTLMVLATVASGATLLPTAAKAQPAPGQSGFFCDLSRAQYNYPVTYYQNRQGAREPWIIWRSQNFTSSGYDPATRCQQVSGRLEGYRRDRVLNKITVGIMNRQRVICTASPTNGRCAGLIYTLRPGTDAVRTLNTFLAWREGQASTPSLLESSARQRPVIDVGSRMAAFEAQGGPAQANPTTRPAPVSRPAARPAPAPAAQPAPAPQGNDGLREL